MLSGVLLLLLACQLATPTPIFDRDGAGFHGRSTGFGETIRDWFRVIKDRIVGKWQEWFGRDSPTPSLSPLDILNIDKSIESRVSGYPGLFIDLFAGNDYDSDSDDWDVKPLNLPLPSIFSDDWTPDFRKFGIPKATQSPMTTPNIETTTSQQQTTQTVTRTQSASISTESTVTEATTETTTETTTEATTEAIVTESISLTTQLITIVEPIATSSEEEIPTSSVMNSEPVAAPTDSTLTSIESITEPIIPPIESTVLSVESISSTESTLTSVKSIETSIESTVITTEAIVTSTEELTAITTESSTTSTEIILPIFNKRVEDNETINKRTTKKPRPASAEVIMF